MDSSYYGFLAAFMIILVVCTFAGSLYDYFWEFLRD